MYILVLLVYFRMLFVIRYEGSDVTVASSASGNVKPRANQYEFQVIEVC